MTHSAERPKVIDQLGHSTFAYNHAIQETEDGYTFIAYLFDHLPTCNEVINTVIQNRYPNGEESAIQRKGILDNHDPEFIAYNGFVEETKANVKAQFQALHEAV